tara:strand:+ start:1337 stop:2731 length:1395 start_codon:yes stop_codon:yes gene_type:complete
MKTLLTIIIFCFIFNGFLTAQTISGNFSQLPNQEIRLEGFNGLNTFPISKTIINENGLFELSYSNDNRGVGYLLTLENQPLFVILSGENIEIMGEALNFPEAITITKGKQNQIYQQYIKEQYMREQVLSAWYFLQKIYAFDSLLTIHKEPVKAINEEFRRIKNEEEYFLNQLPKESYVQWFLPISKLISSVSTIAQYRPEEIPKTIAAFRAIDYADQRLYKSGLLKDAIESHFWLIENSGKVLDSVLVEMQLSIDILLEDLIKDERILNEVTDYLFDLLERQSLFGASEYLAIKVLNETSCTINNDLVKQLEIYRYMKKGNIAPNINFGSTSYLNGMKQTIFNSLTDLSTPYTLVVFGASWCPMCMEELPKLIQNYVEWRNLGVEVVYISLDTEPQVFEQAVKSYPFLSYCDYKKWASQIVEDYYVFATPTFYLLNSKREIILRPNSTEQVMSWVNWFLVQGNK